ncbi:hypothetical protein TWF569_001698 [Orbilia oligospora]|nr:hypothetical protein TWF569_001698 [Orbilia oligospora]
MGAARHPATFGQLDTLTPLSKSSTHALSNRPTNMRNSNHPTGTRCSGRGGQVPVQTNPRGLTFVEEEVVKGIIKDSNIGMTNQVDGQDERRTLPTGQAIWMCNS